MSQWEGKERRGRKARAETPAVINLTIRVTLREKEALIAWASRNNAESLADFCRLILNEAAAEEGICPPLVA